MQIQVNRFIRGIAILPFILILTGCASSGTLRSDYDHDADFGAYQTYNFMERSDSDDYQGFFSQYMTAAITIEMEKRGYTKSNNPDLLVNFNGIIQDKTKVTTRSAPPPMMGGGYYGYRGGYYGAWGSYGYGTETHVSEYTEGTFNIDLIDAKRKQLVWEAVGIGRIDDEAFEELETRIKAGVPNFFALYPFVAGNPNPAVAE